MEEVDIFDHYISAYAFSIKSLKWRKKVFFWLLETDIVNALLLYNMNQEQRKSNNANLEKY